MQLSPQDSVWTRAALEAGGANPGEGDSALAAALAAHGLVMNGGVEHALGVLTESQRLASILGFRYFGLDAAARVFETAAVSRGIDSNVHDRRYWEAVPNDDAIVRAFQAKYETHPHAFAPLGRRSHA